MSNYTKSTNFATKDTLAAGSALKRVKGAEIDDEFNALSTAIATKANLNNSALTGIPVAPTAAVGTATTQIATTAFAQLAGFTAGTAMVFYQASAPTGWTKVTTHNDKALRVVSGSGGGSGGSTAFSSSFTHSHSDSFSVSNHTLNTSQMPSHTHLQSYRPFVLPSYPHTGQGANGSSGLSAVDNGLNAHSAGDTPTQGAGGSGGVTQGHNHGLAGAVASATISPRYVDVIICTKN